MLEVKEVLRCGGAAPRASGSPRPPGWPQPPCGSGGGPYMSREREAGAAVVDVGDVGPRRAIAEGPVADQLDLVVHPLEGAIGHPDPGPRQDAREVGPQRARQLRERLQPAGPPARATGAGLRRYASCRGSR